MELVTLHTMFSSVEVLCSLAPLRGHITWGREGDGRGDGEGKERASERERERREGKRPEGERAGAGEGRGVREGAIEGANPPPHHTIAEHRLIDRLRTLAPSLIRSRT